MPRRKRWSVGDVFTIPVDDSRVAYGQIVHDVGQGHYYFAVFDGLYPRDGDRAADEVVKAPIVLLAPSPDALLYHGRWQYVGTSNVEPGDIPFPAYKEGTSPPGAFDVVDYTGQRRRKATPGERSQLRFRSYVAPIRIEKALRAVHHLEPWNHEFDELRPVSRELTSSALLP